MIGIVSSSGLLADMDENFQDGDVKQAVMGLHTWIACLIGLPNPAVRRLLISGLIMKKKKKSRSISLPIGLMPNYQMGKSDRFLL